MHLRPAREGRQHLTERFLWVVASRSPTAERASSDSCEDREEGRRPRQRIEARCGGWPGASASVCVSSYSGDLGEGAISANGR